METYVVALDQGTTTSRAIVFDRGGEIVSRAQYPFRQIYPQPGWVEHDPMEIWATEKRALAEAVGDAHIDPKAVAALGITNQRETAVLWERATGKPVCNAIVWQCRRTAAICDRLKAEGLEELVTERTGLLLDAYFTGTKLKWMLDHVPGARRRAENGELCAGTVDSWLSWNLTGGKVHVTDYSNASRTMLFNINTLTWDQEILDLMDIPASMLPTPMPSSCLYGRTDAQYFGGPIPIAGAAGDQQAALFGQACFTPGDAKVTYGTGAFLLMNTGTAPIFSKNGLVTTIAWGLNGTVTYALEGSIFMAGAAIQWLRDQLRFIESAGDSEYMAQKVRDTNGCYVVPAFTGLGAPYWDAYARGAIVGLSRGVNKYHIIRATLDSITYQTNDVLTAMASDSGIALSNLKVDGGAASNNYLVQSQADISAAPVLRPKSVETTAMGAAYLAGLAVGYWTDLEDIRKNWSVDRTFTPTLAESQRQKRLTGWKKAVTCTMGWEKD